MLDGVRVQSGEIEIEDAAVFIQQPGDRDVKTVVGIFAKGMGKAVEEQVLLEVDSAAEHIARFWQLGLAAVIDLQLVEEPAAVEFKSENIFIGIKGAI